MAAVSQRQQEIRVGVFVFVAIILMVAFASFMGVFNPLKNKITIHAHYAFAGGIQQGSPVRISGMTVGKVDRIQFNPERLDSDGVSTPVQLVLGIDSKVKDSLRSDSQFYINLAGLIGEKYIEVTPGLPSATALENKADVRGVDPPRIDQLLSQSYGLAGDLRKMFQEKESSIKSTIELMLKVTENLNKLFSQVGSQKNITAKKLDTMFNNFVEISEDLRFMTQQVRSPEGRRALEALVNIILKAEKIDGPTLHQFLQKEGIRTRVDF